MPDAGAGAGADAVIALFPPGTTDREAARLTRHYRWVDFIGIRVFAVALPLLFVALHNSLALALDEARAPGIDAVHDEILWAAAWDAVRER